MTLSEADIKAKELGGKVVGMVHITPDMVQEIPSKQTTCEFYAVKIVTGAAGGHIFHSYLF